MRTRTVTAIVAAGILALTGCSPTDRPVSPPSVSPAGGTATPDATSTPSASASAPAKSPRGNLIKQAGDTFGFGENGDQAANFVVSMITVDAPCTSQFADSPEFGHFIRLDIEGETTASLSQDIFMASGAWFAVAENGTTFNGDPWNMAAAGCLNETERLPSIIGPGERVAGAVLLDVPTAHGVIVLDLGDGLSWEWAY